MSAHSLLGEGYGLTAIALCSSFRAVRYLCLLCKSAHHHCTVSTLRLVLWDNWKDGRDLILGGIKARLWVVEGAEPDIHAG